MVQKIVFYKFEAQWFHRLRFRILIESLFFMAGLPIQIGRRVRWDSSNSEKAFHKQVHKIQSDVTHAHFTSKHFTSKFKCTSLASSQKPVSTRACMRVWVCQNQNGVVSFFEVFEIRLFFANLLMNCFFAIVASPSNSPRNCICKSVMKI